MFESEIAVNEFLLGQFVKTVADIPEESLFQPSVGHGHSPVWLLGHLAIVGESGQRMLGVKISHLEWLRLFGPGSSGHVDPDSNLTKTAMTTSVVEAYEKLRVLAATADEVAVSRPHGLGFFEGTPIKTIKHCVTLLLTNHFGFHLAQLSSCRRVAGFGALF